MIQLFPGALLLIFIALVLGLLAAIAWCMYSLLRAMPARTTFGPFAILICAYAVLLLVGSATSKERRVPLGTDMCFDDWCAAVTGVREAPSSSSGQIVVAGVRVSSDAKRVRQRGSDPHIYFIDNRGTWYPTRVSDGALPLDREIAPGENYETRVEAPVPEDASIVAVRLWEGGWIDRLLPFDDDSFFHGKTLYSV